MIPGADHNSRSLLFRRIRSLSEVTNSSAPAPAPRDERNDSDDALRQPLLRLTSSFLDDDGNEIEISNTDNNDDILSLFFQYIPSLEYEERSDSSLENHENEDNNNNNNNATKQRTDWKLWIVFCFLVASGVGNFIFAKLQSLPMYNYPTFLNIYANGMYVLISFAYIIPVSTLGLFGNSIPRAVPSRAIKPFFIMGGLDALGAAMQVLATVYLPGTLLVLLPQVAIPLSMAAGSLVLGEKYTMRQYAGAAVVFCGILVVLYPILSHEREAAYYCKAIDSDSDCLLCREETTEQECLSHNADNNTPSLDFLSRYQEHNNNNNNNNSTNENENENENGNDNDNGNDHNNNGYYCDWVSKKDASMRDEDFLVFFWSIVMLLSCIPSVMSTVYKQVALQTATSMDPILINGWVSLFQLVCGLFLVIPSGLVSSPRVHPLEIGSNWMAGINCLFSQTNSIEIGCHPDDCSSAALWVHVSLANAVVYALSMLFVLKYGSCDLMYLGLTLVVPLGHLAFDYHSSFSDLKSYDIAGLAILVAGLMLYRFGNRSKSRMGNEHGTRSADDGDDNDDDDDDDDGNPYTLITSQGGDELGSGNGTASSGQRSTAAAATTNTAANNDTASANQDKSGFLEFLREPFMLVGDI